MAVAIADGYARKSKKAILIQLHSGVGLENGIGMMYQAFRGRNITNSYMWRRRIKI